MFFPYATDTPVKYFPIATIVLILVNVAIYSMGYNAFEDPEIPTEWALTYGAGLQPSQWLTANFIHGGPYHVFINVVFLWVFGLIVEGKAGWLRMLSIYFGVILLQSAFEQTVMSFVLTEPAIGSLGASAAIYGLMAVAFVWAPKSEFDCFWFALFFWGTARVAFVFVAVFFIAIDQVALFALSDYAGSNWMRVFGALFGLPVGFALLMTKQIDQDGWDLIHVWKGQYGATTRKSRSDYEAIIEARESAELLTLQAQALERFDNLLDQGEPVGAAKLWKKLGKMNAGIELDNERLIRVTQALHDADKWGESAPFMALMIDAFPQRSDLLRLKLAQVCVVELSRPGRALDLIDQIDKEQLSEEDRVLRRAIRKKARSLQDDEDFVEVDDGEW